MLYPPGMRNSNNNSQSSSPSGASKSELDRLSEKYEKLKLVCMAMWTFIKEQSNIDEDDLIIRVKEIDRMDGNEDGKLKIGIKHCSKCKRTLNPKFDKCLYCGTPAPITSIFETL